MSIRNKSLLNFEKILYEEDKDKDGLYNIAIVDGGPTGVQLARAFAEMIKDVMSKDNPNILAHNVNVYLFEFSNNTLSVMSPYAQKYSEKYLRKMAVIVNTRVFLKQYDGETVVLSNGKSINSKNVI